MLGKLTTQGIVNLERAMLATGRFEGHVVLGHVDRTIPCSDITHNSDQSSLFEFALPSDHQQYFVNKGNIVINGVALTIANVDKKAGVFSVAIIPHTYYATQFHKLCIGDHVNIECDYFAKLWWEWKQHAKRTS